MNAQWATLKARGTELLEKDVPAFNKKLWDAGFGSDLEEFKLLQVMMRRSIHRLQLIIAITWLHLFEKTMVVKDFSEVSEELKDETDFSRIRCPLCRWQPHRSDRWCCSDCHAPEYFYDGCGAEWNTFETRGVCPGCGHQWRWTMCLSCGEWSLHEDWYSNEKK